MWIKNATTYTANNLFIELFASKLSVNWTPVDFLRPWADGGRRCGFRGPRQCSYTSKNNQGGYSDYSIHKLFLLQTQWSSAWVYSEFFTTITLFVPHSYFTISSFF
jgi:hypothetical protein